MAEDKKSFVLYADYIHTVRKMPKDKAGELFLTILAYVNDENPEPDDLLVQLAFEPIKQQLKRDLRKWEKKRKNLSRVGKMGGIKSGEARRKQIEANEANASKSNQNEANEAVTANANANVTANVNVAIASLSREKIFELLRMKTSANKITDRQIWEETSAFIKKYDGTQIGNLGALINTWAGNIKPEKPKGLVQ